MVDHHELSKANAPADQKQEAGAVKRTKFAKCRSQRFRDLRKVALEEADPLRSNLRSAAADLLELGYLLSEGIRAAMRAAANGLEVYEDVAPAIDRMALVHRQATRYVQIDQGWASGKDSG